MAVDSTEDSMCCSKLPPTSAGKLTVITKEGEKELKDYEVDKNQ